MPRTRPFARRRSKFLAHAQETINPSLSDADVREMLIQHILTEEIFFQVFGEDDFHQREQRREGTLRAGGNVFHR